MHIERPMNFQTQLDAISKLASEGVLNADVLIAELRQGLELLGFEDFAAITATNFNVIQRAVSTFAPADKFFAREVKSLFAADILKESFETKAPVIKPCGLSLNAPFDLVWLNKPATSYFLLFNIYRDRFTLGYFVAFGDSAERLKSQVWQLFTIAQLAMDLVKLVPVGGTEKKALTDNEISVLRWTYEDKTASEVAEIMEVKLRTVNYYINCSIKKLDAKNKNQAAKKAKEMGLF